MQWDEKYLEETTWAAQISNFEIKLALAKKIAEFVKYGDVIGFGSGSTSFIVITEIAKKIRENSLKISAIPTSPEIALACHSLGIPVDSLSRVRPDWSFDGADEIDPQKNLIKGRGGAMFIEKLIMLCSNKVYIVADNTKLVKTLGEKFPIPVEIAPEALVYVRRELYRLGAYEAALRPALGKDGPLITANANYILDTRFEKIPDTLERDIKSIAGVIESGLFWGYAPEIVTI